MCDLGEKDFKILRENERADGVDDNVRVLRDGDEKDDILMAWRSENLERKNWIRGLRVIQMCNQVCASFFLFFLG